jgi:hypothetical protein
MSSVIAKKKLRLKNRG